MFFISLVLFPVFGLDRVVLAKRDFVDVRFPTGKDYGASYGNGGNTSLVPVTVIPCTPQNSAYNYAGKVGFCVAPSNLNVCYYLYASPSVDCPTSDYFCCYG